MQAPPAGGVCTHVSSEQVALAAGFSTPERMAKVFQHMLDMSPSEYRAKRSG